AAGHEVTGMTRSAAKANEVRALGARPVIADALDADGVARVVAESEPDVIVHELTALAGSLSLRNFDKSFAVTNRLRTEGTDHLLAAGRAMGVRRFVIQSYTGWPYAKVGGPIKTERDPLDPSAPKTMRRSIAAIRYLEEAVTGA